MSFHESEILTPQEQQAAVFDAILRRVGPGAAGRRSMIPPTEDVSAIAAAAPTPAATGIGAGGKPFSLKGLGEEFLRSLVGVLPNPEDARFAALEASQIPGASPIEAGVSGALFRGPISSRQTQLKENTALTNALLKRLGLQEREAELESKLLTTPRDKDEKPVGEVTLPLSGRKIPLYKRAGPLEQMLLAIGAAVEKQKELRPGEAQAERERQTSQEAARQRAAQQTVVVTAAQKAVDDMKETVKARRKAFEEALVASEGSIVGKFRLDDAAKAATVALLQAESALNARLKAAKRPPLPSSTAGLPASHKVQKYIRTLQGQ